MHSGEGERAGKETGMLAYLCTSLNPQVHLGV